MNVERVKEKIFRAMNLGMAGLGLSVFVITHIFDVGLRRIGVGAACFSIVAFVLHFSNHFFPDLKYRARILVTTWICVASYLAYVTGGITGPLPVMLVPIPLLVLIFLPMRETVAWIALLFSLLTVMALTQIGGGEAIEWSAYLMDVTALMAVSIIGIIQHSFTEAHRRESETARAQLIGSAQFTALGEMSAGVSHEINNPLCIISMKLSQLQDLSKAGTLSLQALEDGLENASSACERISKIVNGLRVYARDSVNDEFEMSSVKTIIEDVLSLTRERLKKDHIELRVADISANVNVECKKAQIGQVLMNLINNSYDAVKTLEEKWIKIEISDTKKFVTISFSDSGKGIKSDIAEKIMQPFFTTKAIGEGTGLGLSVSLGIVKSHHGTLELDHRSDRTCFVITLPKIQELYRA